MNHLAKVQARIEELTRRFHSRSDWRRRMAAARCRLGLHPCTPFVAVEKRLKASRAEALAQARARQWAEAAERRRLKIAEWENRYGKVGWQ